MRSGAHSAGRLCGSIGSAWTPIDLGLIESAVAGRPHLAGWPIARHEYVEPAGSPRESMNASEPSKATMTVIVTGDINTLTLPRGRTPAARHLHWSTWPRTRPLGGGPAARLGSPGERVAGKQVGEEARTGSCG